MNSALSNILNSLWWKNPAGSWNSGSELQEFRHDHLWMAEISQEESIGRDGKGEMVQRKPREEGVSRNSPSWVTCCCLVAKSCPTLWPHELQHARLPWPSPSPSPCSNSCPLSRDCHPAISCSVTPFFSCPQSFPGLFQWVGSSHQVAKVLELQHLHQSLQWIFRVNIL